MDMWSHKMMNFSQNIQKMTDTNIELLDKILGEKEKEILQI